MGCDIHAGIYAKDFRMELRAAPDITRNYELFGLLAGVRGDGPAFIEPRGFPPGFHLDPDMEGVLWGEHTPSYYTLKELKDFVARKPSTEYFPNTTHQLLRLVRWMEFVRDDEREEHPERTEDDIYLIFNFDN